MSGQDQAVPSAVKIPPQTLWSLGFDLAEVMSAVGAKLDLRWRLKSAELVLDTAPDASRARWEVVEATSVTAGPGVELTWEEMESLARDCLQVIDGTFTGYSGRNPRLQMAAVDSSYWIVWADDPVVIERVRRSFHSVTDYDEPEPRPLDH